MSGEGTRTNNKGGSNVKKEPTTPRSIKLFTFERNRYGRGDENMTEQFSTDITGSSKKPNPCVISWRARYPISDHPFKIKCNLRIFVPIDSNTRLINRRVYTLDCNEHCKKYAKTPENPNGRFENCYESSCLFWSSIVEHDVKRCDLRVFLNAASSHYRRVFVLQCSGDCGKFCERYRKFANLSSWPYNSESYSSDDYRYNEKCALRVSLDEASSHNRRIFVLQCSGDCGKLCENHKPRQTLEEYLESMDFDSYATTEENSDGEFDDFYESSWPNSFKSYHYNKRRGLRVRLDAGSFHNREVFVLR